MRLRRKQLTSRPDHLWPELWKSMGKHAKLKEKQKWSNEKLHLEKARKLRGIYFIDPEDKEFKETIKNARKKLETSVAPDMPCKIMKNCGSGGSDKVKTKLACILEADESTRLRMGNSVPNYHEDHIAGKGDNSLQHYNLVHKFIPMPQAMKFPAAKSSGGQGMGNIGKISAWNLTKVRSKSEVIDEARTSGAKVHFASLMDISHHLSVSMASGQPMSATQRRKERRLRSWWRHEQQSIAMPWQLRRTTACSRKALFEARGQPPGLRRQTESPPEAPPGILAEPGSQRSDRSLRHPSGKCHVVFGGCDRRSCGLLLVRVPRCLRAQAGGGGREEAALEADC